MIARQGGLSEAVARVALSDLVETGVVARIGHGRSVNYQIDATHPLTPAVEQLFVAESARRTRIFDALRDAALTLHPAPLGVWVYGSVARGTDTPTSDLDVAVCGVDPAALESQTTALRERGQTIGDTERVQISVISFTLDDARRLARENASIWRGIVDDGFTLVGRSPALVVDS